MDVFKEFAFEAAHCLPNVPVGHKCARLHGHSYRVEVHVRGTVYTHTGWVMDFAEIAAIARPVIDQLDHHYLNEVEGLENPTSENLALWLWRNLTGPIRASGEVSLAKVVVRETCTSGCIYEGA